MDFQTIRKKFEAKEYFARMDFIDNYDFKDDYHEYYRKFIFDAILKVKDGLYLSDLIELANHLDFFDMEMCVRIQNLLFQKQALVVKICVIDYLEMWLRHSNDFNAFESLFKPLLLTKLHELLRNQILLNLLKYSNLEKEYYFEQLISSIEKTEDWRSIHRTLDCLNHQVSPHFSSRLVQIVRNLHEQKDFGEGVTQLLERLEN
jgi:hypothetical protein